MGGVQSQLCRQPSILEINWESRRNSAVVEDTLVAQEKFYQYVSLCARSMLKEFKIQGEVGIGT